MYLIILSIGIILFYLLGKILVKWIEGLESMNDTNESLLDDSEDNWYNEQKF